MKHDGNTFTWADICASNNIGLGTVYEFPCVRLTPMDLFQEARWYMTDKDRVSWYNNGIKKSVVAPRIGRFGIMKQQCAGADQCMILLGTRLANDNALQLFSDLTGMQMNDPCRICIETNFDATMNYLTDSAQGTFYVLLLQLQRSLATLQAVPVEDQDMTKIAKVGGLHLKILAIIGKIDRPAIEEWFMYYTTRGLYTELGAKEYITKHDVISAMCPGGCFPSMEARLLSNDAIFKGDPANVARFDLANHADTAFSSTNTAGNPYPVIGLGPQGGSGIDFKGAILDTATYLDLGNFGKDECNPKFGATGTDGSAGIADPDDIKWAEHVETDPVFKWFMAGETPMTARKLFHRPLYSCFIHRITLCHISNFALL